MDFGRKKSKTVEYFPNVIGQSSPGSPSRYAFLIVGRDDRTAPIVILDSILKYGTKILSQMSYVNEGHRDLTICVCCEFDKARITPDDLLIQLRLLKPVLHAESVSMNNKIFDGFLFPLTLMDSIRVVAMDSNFAFELEERMDTQEGKSALQDVGRIFALEVVKSIREKFGMEADDDHNDNSHDNSASNRKQYAFNGSASLNYAHVSQADKVVRENALDYFKAAGWGTFRWESDATLERIIIQDAPVSKKGNGAGNNFVCGIAAGLVEGIRRQRMSVAEDSYDPTTRSLSVVLVERPVKLLPKPKSEKVEAVEEQKEEEIEEEDQEGTKEVKAPEISVVSSSNGSSSSSTSTSSSGSNNIGIDAPNKEYSVEVLRALKEVNRVIRSVEHRPVLKEQEEKPRELKENLARNESVSVVITGKGREERNEEEKEAKPEERKKQKEKEGDQEHAEEAKEVDVKGNESGKDKGEREAGEKAEAKEAADLSSSSEERSKEQPETAGSAEEEHYDAEEEEKEDQTSETNFGFEAEPAYEEQSQQYDVSSDLSVWQLY